MAFFSTNGAASDSSSAVHSHRLCSTEYALAVLQRKCSRVDEFSCWNSLGNEKVCEVLSI